jgi:hypothetical protein
MGWFIEGREKRFGKKQDAPVSNCSRVGEGKDKRSVSADVGCGLTLKPLYWRGSETTDC